MANPKKREKLPSFVSPKGTFNYPKLTEPDFGTKEYPKPEGQFKVDLIVPAGQAASLISKLQPLFDAAVEAGKAEWEKLPKPKQKQFPFKENPFYTDQVDADGNETGNVIFKFKRAASGTFKKGPKEGQKWNATVGLFDTKGKPLPKGVDIWSGTVGYVAFEVSSYYKPVSGAGISLRLEAAQIVELRGPGAARAASAYGFGSDEDGYEAAEKAAADDDADDAPTSDGAETGADDESDF